MTTRFSISMLLAAFAVTPLAAQGVGQIANNTGEVRSSAPTQAAVSADSTAHEPASSTALVIPSERSESRDLDSTAHEPAFSTAPPIRVQNVRPPDQRGLNVFEAPRDDTPYQGFVLDIGGAFTQQFQALDHTNTAGVKTLKDAAGKDYNANELLDIGMGFNLAAANLNLNAQLAPGIRVALESYMSSRHHNEFWVKGGYLQIDQSPIDNALLNTLMNYLTIKAGMFELNYGDAHFRRSDNGNAVFNPFVENHILDSFNTEIGTEILFRAGPWLAMAGVTDGLNKGGVNVPDQRGPAFLGKLGFDQQVTPDLRLRLTGSIYDVDKTPSNNLFGGDRSGSRYYSVMENTQSTLTAQAFSGRINPGFRNELTAMQINPFVKVGGLEMFGVLEHAEGRANTEAARRHWDQYAGDVIYRLQPHEQLFAGARYNVARGELAGITNKVKVNRMAFSAGWFMTPNVLVKGEYVTQEYIDFPTSDIRNGGEFDGFVLEGVIAF